jgi:hypothetical protein
VGRTGTAGNVYTGREASGGRGVVYDPKTGEGKSVAAARGEGGAGVARVGDDVYAGRDGNVYRRSEGGWEQRNSSGGWSSASGDAARGANVDRDYTARSQGTSRTNSYQGASRSMWASRGGMRGGGGGRRR